MKIIPITKSKKSKFLTDEEAEKMQDERRKGNKDYEPQMIPLDTLHIITNVIQRQDKGPHGEPQGVKVPAQRKIFKILDKIEALPEDAKEIEFEDGEIEFIVKRTKAYKDRWWAVDKIFDEFETAFGIIEEEDEETK
jgi:hypothetical protein